MSKINIFLVCIISFFLATSCSQDTKSYTVSGKLDNVKDSFFFAARETGDSLFVDTISINNKGEFSFKGYVDTLTVISLYFKESVVSPYVLVDKGWDVKIDGDINLPDLIVAKGGSINNDLTKFKNDHAELLKSRSELMKHKADLSAKGDSVANKEYTVELKNVNFELLNIASDYVKSNPAKIASVILINNFFKNEESLERLNESLDQLRGVAHDYPLAIQLREFRDKIKKSAVGSMAPSFNLKDDKGENITLSKYRGKYLLISFVSTTCGVCEDMRPDVEKVYNNFRRDKKNIEFISIIKDVEDKPLSDRKALKWVSIPEYGGWASKVFEDYNIKELPYSILISREGKILERNVSIYNLSSKLDTYPGINK